MSTSNWQRSKRIANAIGKVMWGNLLVAMLLSAGGCVTGSTIAAARERVYYRPSKWENGRFQDPEVDHVKKAQPAYYALVPIAVAADVALTPVYIAVLVAVNTGMMSPP
jgi:hypothetical protein